MKGFMDDSGGPHDVIVWSRWYSGGDAPCNCSS